MQAAGISDHAEHRNIQIPSKKIQQVFALIFLAVSLMCALGKHSLRVHLVKRAVDAHGGAEARDSFVILQARQDASQGGGDQIC